MPAAAACIEPCPAQLSSDQIERFRADGYLAFDGFLDATRVAEGQAAMTELLRTLVERARGGELKLDRNPAAMRNYSGYRIMEPGADTGVLFEPGLEIDLERMDFAALERSYRKFSTPSKGHGYFARLSADARLMRLLEPLLGPAPILYGDMALCKPPRIGSSKPWHQDSAYFLYEPFDAGVDVWIALDDATIENGCMFVLPGAHHLGPRRHEHRDDCTVADGRLDLTQAVPVELKAGGVLLFSVVLPHYTPPNRSERRRRAMQLFYRGAQTRLIGSDEKLANYRESDGTPASCAAAGQAANKKALGAADA